MREDLTILLLLKDRDDFTIRWLEYARKIKIPYKIILSNGGLESDLNEKLHEKEFHLELDLEYIRYPYDANHAIFFSKVYDSLKKVKTPFVLLASNDDFYFLDALESSISFLKDNLDYSSSRGEIWDFSTSQGGMGRPKSSDHSTYGRMEGISKLYHDPSVFGGSAMERVLNFSSRANSTWHDVIRTESLKAAYSALLNSEINDLVLADSLISFFIASRGQIHRGDGLYMLHQCHSEMAALTVLHSSPFEWVNSPDWDSELEKFLDVISLQVSSQDQTSFYEAKCRLLKAYIKYSILDKMANFFNYKINDRKNKNAIVSYVKHILKKNNYLYIFFRSILKIKAGDEIFLDPFPTKIAYIRKFLLKIDFYK